MSDRTRPNWRFEGLAGFDRSSRCGYGSAGTFVWRRHELNFLSGFSGRGFASTNIDDLFILVGFFSDKSLSPTQVVLGQFAGIGLLVGASLSVALAALAISPAYVGLLGIAPILLGLMKLRSALSNLSGKDIHAREPSKRRLEAVGVASVTIASGGDNIGIYAPLFANQSRLQMMQTIAVLGG